MQDERTGVDEALRWKLITSHADTTEAVIQQVRELPVDHLLLIDWEPSWDEIHAAGLHCNYMPLDMAWLIVGPQHQEHARKYRQETYRVVGEPCACH